MIVKVYTWSKGVPYLSRSSETGGLKQLNCRLAGGEQKIHTPHSYRRNYVESV